MPLIDPLKHDRHVPENVNERHRRQLKIQDKMALLITTAIGTMYAVYFFGLFMAGWMLWQSLGSDMPFDPYPFAFLLFLGNIVQLLLMPLIMVGQNIQGRHAEIRADEEYKTTVTSYHDIAHILRQMNAQDDELVRQSKLLEELSQKLEGNARQA